MLNKYQTKSEQMNKLTSFEIITKQNVVRHFTFHSLVC